MHYPVVVGVSDRLGNISHDREPSSHGHAFGMFSKPQVQPGQMLVVRVDQAGNEFSGDMDARG